METREEENKRIIEANKLKYKEMNIARNIAKFLPESLYPGQTKFVCLAMGAENIDSFAPEVDMSRDRLRALIVGKSAMLHIEFQKLRTFAPSDYIHPLEDIVHRKKVYPKRSKSTPIIQHKTFDLKTEPTAAFANWDLAKQSAEKAISERQGREYDPSYTPSFDVHGKRIKTDDEKRIDDEETRREIDKQGFDDPDFKWSSEDRTMTENVRTYTHLLLKLNFPNHLESECLGGRYLPWMPEDPKDMV